MWAVAGVLYVWPRLAGALLASFRLANWGFWLVTLGIGSMALVLSAQGLQQGFMLISSAEFVDTVVAIRPYWWVRTLTGLSMDVGTSLLVYVQAKCAECHGEDGRGDGPSADQLRDPAWPTSTAPSPPASTARRCRPSPTR